MSLRSSAFATGAVVVDFGASAAVQGWLRTTRLVLLCPTLLGKAPLHRPRNNNNPSARVIVVPLSFGFRKRTYYTNGRAAKGDDPYEVLGLRWGDGATTSDIRRAFRERAMRLHPDVVVTAAAAAAASSATSSAGMGLGDGVEGVDGVDGGSPHPPPPPLNPEQAKVEFQKLVAAYEALLKHVSVGMDGNDNGSVEEWRVALWRQSDRIALDRTDVAGVARKRPAPPAQTESRKAYHGRELGHPSGGGVVGRRRGRGEYLHEGSGGKDDDPADADSNNNNNNNNPQQQRRRPKQSSSVGRGRSKWTTGPQNQAKEYKEWDPTTSSSTSSSS